MAAPIIQFKREVYTNLPGLRYGEPGFTTDKYDLYVVYTVIQPISSSVQEDWIERWTVESLNLN